MEKSLDKLQQEAAEVWVQIFRVQAWYVSNVSSWRCTWWCCQFSSCTKIFGVMKIFRIINLSANLSPDPLRDGTILLHLLGKFLFYAESFQSGHFLRIRTFYLKKWLSCIIIWLEQSCNWVSITKDAAVGVLATPSHFHPSTTWNETKSHNFSQIDWPPA